MSFEKDWEWPYLKETTSSRRNWSAGRAFNTIAVVAGAVSLIAFMCGLYQLNGVY
ncbi:hypothetical protein ACVOMV_36430 [Mesorhizobium atlanticum]